MITLIYKRQALHQTGGALLARTIPYGAPASVLVAIDCYWPGGSSQDVGIKVASPLLIESLRALGIAIGYRLSVLTSRSDRLDRMDRMDEIPT